VSSETPAAHLARLKVTYQGWRIVRDGGRLTAVERATGHRLNAATPGELENRLADAETRRAQPQGRAPARLRDIPLTGRRRSPSRARFLSHVMACGHPCG
jgi:hypothetical protein